MKSNIAIVPTLQGDIAQIIYKEAIKAALKKDLTGHFEAAEKIIKLTNVHYTKLFLELIGEDEPMMMTIKTRLGTPKQQTLPQPLARNKLKAELRTKVKAWGEQE